MLPAGGGEEDQSGLQKKGLVMALLLDMSPRNLLWRCT